MSRFLLVSCGHVTPRLETGMQGKAEGKKENILLTVGWVSVILLLLQSCIKRKALQTNKNITLCFIIIFILLSRVNSTLTFLRISVMYTFKIHTNQNILEKKNHGFKKLND